MRGTVKFAILFTTVGLITDSRFLTYASLAILILEWISDELQRIVAALDETNQ